MKIIPLSRYLYPIIPFFLLGQSIDTTIVKYFPTDLTRSILLKDGVDSSKLRKRAYFKATYDGGGDLIKVEYVPASRDQGLPLDTAGTRVLYYTDWNDYKRELTNPITEWEAGRIPHYKATFGRSGRLTYVDRYTGLSEKLYTYKIRWNREGTRSAYKVTFHVKMPITQLDSILFAPPASEMRPDWVADFKSIEDGRPKSVRVYDEIGYEYYNYKFYYEDLQDTVNQTERITARYFQADTTYLGSHDIYLAKSLYLTQLDYFSPNGTLISRDVFWLDTILEDVLVTTANEEGEIIGRHIVPKANTLWRQYRLGGVIGEEDKEITVKERKVGRDRVAEEEEEKDLVMMNVDLYGSLPMLNGLGGNMDIVLWAPGYLIGAKLPWALKFRQSQINLLFEYMYAALPAGFYKLELNGFNALASYPVIMDFAQGINIIGGLGMFLSSHGQINNANALALIGGAEFRLVSTAFSNSRIKTVFGVRGMHLTADPRDDEATMNFLMFHVGFIYAL